MPSSLFFSPQRTADADAPAASYDPDDEQHEHRHPPHQQVVVLDDAPIEAGRVRDFVARGRTLKNTLHPLLAHGEAWVTERQLNARSQTSFLVALFSQSLHSAHVSRAQVLPYSHKNSSYTPSRFPTTKSPLQEQRCLLPSHTLDRSCPHSS